MVGAEGGGGETVFVGEVRHGVVAPGEADCYGLGYLIAVDDDRSAVNRGLGRQELLILPGNRKIYERFVVARD